MEKTFNITRRDDGIAIIVIDVPNETMNTLKAEFANEVIELLDDVKNDNSIKGLVLISGKNNSFIAGADISMLDSCETEQDAVNISMQAHQVFSKLEKLPIPVVAAIHGPCLGGGLELAMACHHRVCTDSTTTQLGLPEVQLGLLPGGGGTQRLPKLVGVTKALDLMLTGKNVRPKQALKMGLVDDVVAVAILEKTAIEMALKPSAVKRKLKLNLVNTLLESTSVTRNIIFDQASKQVMKKTYGNYPAPFKIIDCVKQGVNGSLDKGLATEASHFAKLVMSPESAALRSLFFATTQMKKETGVKDVKPKKIFKAAVLGGGLMGGGIASVTTTKANIPIRVKDINQQGLSNALAYAYKLLQKKVKRRHMTATKRDKLMSLMTVTTQYQGIQDQDILVEAVFEDLALKRQMVQEIEQHCGPNTIFASNTSSLPIADIAKGAQRPENIIGLHYFSPVEKMPLVEVIPHKTTSTQTIATTVAFAKSQGKTAIVVQDGAGFYVNRILALYMNEAAQVLLEGEKVELLDRALMKFGFPVGPITLLDEVGIDVGAKISPILENKLGARFAAPPAFEQLLNDGRMGKKNAKGFYLYGDQHKKTKKVDHTVYNLLGITEFTNRELNEIAERCVIQMLNEAVRCLEENIIASPRDGDIGAIFGIGFPPFLGGPFRYIDTLGASTLVAKLANYQAQFGDRFTPCEMLTTMADNNQTFYYK